MHAANQQDKPQLPWSCRFIQEQAFCFGHVSFIELLTNTFRVLKIYYLCYSQTEAEDSGAAD